MIAHQGHQAAGVAEVFQQLDTQVRVTLARLFHLVGDIPGHVLTFVEEQRVHLHGLHRLVFECYPTCETQSTVATF